MQKKTYYAPFIDGLRAIAVLSVVFYHLDARWLPGGFSGVDVFFVISGFVVSASAQGLPSMKLHQFLAYFYARRLARIAPALVVCLVSTALASALFVPNAYLSDANQKTGLYAFFGLSNFVLTQTSADYFSPITEFNPYTHTWSLAIEEQFYLIFPFLFFYWITHRHKRSIALFVVAILASITCSLWLSHTNPTTAFYMIWSRFWELGAGVILYQLMAKNGHSFENGSLNRKWFNLGAVFSLLVLIAGLIFSNPKSGPFMGCILSIIGAIGILGFCHGRPQGIVHTILTNAFFRLVGKISYSLYLWHWPVFVLFRWTLGIDSWSSRLAALSLTIALAVLSYYFVETPPRKAAARMPRIAAIVAGLTAIIFGFAASSQIVEHQPNISLTVVSKEPAAWYPAWITVSPTNPKCTIASQASDVQGGVVWKFSRAGCDEERKLALNIYVIGDSHAMTYAPMFTRLALQTGIDIFAYNNGGCPFVSLQLKGLAPHCTSYGNAAVADILPRLKKGDIVFLPSLRLPRLVDQWEDFGIEQAHNLMFGADGVKGRRLGEQQAIDLLKLFTDKGAVVILEAPKPIFRYVPFRCSDWFNKNNPICSHGNSIPRAFLEELRAPVLESYAQLQAINPSIRVWDPFPVLCTSTSCSTWRDNKPLFFDGDHLSGFGNEVLVASFRDFVASQH